MASWPSLASPITRRSGSLLSRERINPLTNSWSSAMTILAEEEGEEEQEEEVLWGLCVVVVSLVFLFAKGRL